MIYQDLTFFFSSFWLLLLWRAYRIEKKKKGKINNRKSNFDCWTPPAEEKLGCAHQSKLDFLLYEIPTTIPLKKSQPHKPFKRL